MINDIINLRHELHNNPEPSGKERKTKALLIEFLRSRTTLEIHPCGDGFFAAHRESTAAKPSIALRADYDALPLPDGSAAHLCGHDGHAASLCGVALLLEGRRLDRNVFLLFQPAEETGQGAKKCSVLFDQEHRDEIYGAHNLPGYPLGQVFTRFDTFACASQGLILTLCGKPAHAAYPEHGISPAPAVGQFLCSLPSLSAPSRYTSMTLCTVIGTQMGERAFGKAASQAEIWLTLRAAQDIDMRELQTAIIGELQRLADEFHLTFSYRLQDIFPATRNHPLGVQRLLHMKGTQLLDSPMRWSEDFGHYLNHCSGAFWGIGAGETCAPLHTAGYEYPDDLLQPTIEAFYHLVE